MLNCLGLLSCVFSCTVYYSQYQKSFWLSKLPPKWPEPCRSSIHAYEANCDKNMQVQQLQIWPRHVQTYDKVALCRKLKSLKNQINQQCTKCIKQDENR